MDFVKHLIGTLWNIIATVIEFIVDLIVKFIHLFV